MKFVTSYNILIFKTIMKFYTYKNCSTCKNAKKFLVDRGVTVSEIPIRDTPPSISELKEMLGIYNGDIKRLFNVSGQDYRAMNLKESLPIMSIDEALALLNSNGNLVKRPFFLTESSGCVGFKPDQWAELLA